MYPLQIDLFMNHSPNRVVRGHLNATLATLKTKLTTQTWPANLRSEVKGDVAAVAAYAKLFAHFTVAPRALSADELQRLDSIPLTYDTVIDKLRFKLGLPPGR